MTVPFMDAYVRLLIKTCHKRKVAAIGGMSAQIPVKSESRCQPARRARASSTHHSQSQSQTTRSATKLRSPKSSPTRSAKSPPATMAPGSLTQLSSRSLSTFSTRAWSARTSTTSVVRKCRFRRSICSTRTCLAQSPRPVSGPTAWLCFSEFEYDEL